MTHLTEDTLRTYLDHELAEAEHALVQSHLAACAGCRAELSALEARAAQVKARLATLAPGEAEISRAAPFALAQFKRKEKPTMFQSIFSRRMRPLWAGVTLVAVLALSLSFAPVRALASSFLGLFRVQQVSVLPVDTTRLNALTGHTPLSAEISRVLSGSVTVTRPAGEPQEVNGAAEASQLAGFNVRLPADSAVAPQLTVQSGMAFQFKVDRAQAQALLDESGRQDLQLPASVDGAVVKVDVPAGVTASYGTCPNPTGKQADPDVRGSAGRMFPDCVIFVQMPSPTVSTPPDLDIAQLAELGLQFSGMTAQQARDYSQTVDWASTLVIPIPQNGATYKQVPVDGVTGYLIQRPADDAPEYVLVWVKDGTVYAIGALGADTAKALALANALK
jgi:predicted anti-sigma-YlaC factor YlaD